MQSLTSYKCIWSQRTQHGIWCGHIFAIYLASYIYTMLCYNVKHDSFICTRETKKNIVEVIEVQKWSNWFDLFFERLVRRRSRKISRSSRSSKPGEYSLHITLERLRLVRLFYDASTTLFNPFMTSRTQVSTNQPWVNMPYNFTVIPACLSQYRLCAKMQIICEEVSIGILFLLTFDENNSVDSN